MEPSGLDGFPHRDGWWALRLPTAQAGSAARSAHRRLALWAGSGVRAQRWRISVAQGLKPQLCRALCDLERGAWRELSHTRRAALNCTVGRSRFCSTGPGAWTLMGESLQKLGQAGSLLPAAGDAPRGAKCSLSWQAITAAPAVAAPASGRWRAKARGGRSPSSLRTPRGPHRPRPWERPRTPRRRWLWSRPPKG